MKAVDEVIGLSVALMAESPALRLGQAYFIALHRMMPELALEIKGGENDPFYDDSKIPEFFDFLISKEEEEEGEGWKSAA